MPGFNRGLLLAFSAAAFLNSCSTVSSGGDASLTERIANAVNEAEANCGGAFISTARSYRETYGLPFCREQYRSEWFRDALPHDAASGISYERTDAKCSATFRAGGARRFNAALTEAMAGAGFVETGEIIIVQCVHGTCNGRFVCDDVEEYRHFYRRADNIAVTASYGSKNYPDVAKITVAPADDDHICAGPDAESACFAPGGR